MICYHNISKETPCGSLFLCYNIDMEYVFKKNLFPDIDVSWEDVVIKTCEDSKVGQMRAVFDKQNLPTFACHTKFRPGTLQTAYDYCNSKFEEEYPVMHVYYSFGDKVKTYGNHRDGVEVKLVQAYGSMVYVLHNKIRIEMEKGDYLYVPSGVYHNPIVPGGPRINLSFSPFRNYFDGEEGNVQM